MGTKEKVGKILTKTARILPGIGSYQEKESIRENDKKLREHISSRITHLLQDIERLKTDLSRQWSMSFLRDLDDISRHLDKLSRTIGFASRGYAGVFSLNQIDEEALSRLFKFDLSLKEKVGNLDSLVSRISEEKEELSAPILHELQEFLFGIERRIYERESLLHVHLT